MFVVNVAAGVSVVNVLVIVFMVPPSAATAVTVYRWETPSAQVECQAVAAWFMVPGTGPDGLPLSAAAVPVGVTVTDLSVPLVAVTVTPADGSAAFAPLAGEMVTPVAGLAVALPPAPVLAAGLAAPTLPAGVPVSLVVLAVHAAASRVTAMVTATVADLRARAGHGCAGFRCAGFGRAGFGCDAPGRAGPGTHAPRTRSTFSRSVPRRLRWPAGLALPAIKDDEREHMVIAACIAAFAAVVAMP
jgi:hypothetical protein